MRNTAQTRTWNALLDEDEDLARRARVAIEETAREIDALRGLEDFTLAGGLAGLAFFEDALGRAERAADLLGDAGERMASVPAAEGLYSGVCGVALVTHTLTSDSDEAAETTAEIDALLLQWLERGARATRSFDLVSGVAGVGVYAVIARSSTLVEAAIETLDALAEADGPGVTWRTPPTLLAGRPGHFPDGRFDLGVAHGVAGVIGFLARACGEGLGGSHGRALLAAASAWLLAERAPDVALSRFAAYRGPHERGEPGCRLAWCYGDAGNAVVLLDAARVLGDRVLEREAVAIARGAARRNEGDSGVRDAGLCHGAGGLLHLFNVLYQATGENDFADAARRWADVALRAQRPTPGPSFPAWRIVAPSGAGRYLPEPGLLEGAAGVALALHAALEPTAPRWDAMLVSVVHDRAFREA